MKKWNQKNSEKNLIPKEVSDRFDRILLGKCQIKKDDSEFPYLLGKMEKSACKEVESKAIRKKK